MRLRPSAVGAALALGALSFPAASAAQAADGFVLPFGMFRLGFEGTHATYESLFDAAGTRVPLASGAGGELTPDRFAAIVPLATDLTGFLEATHGGPGASPEPPDPATLSLGTLDLLAAGTEARAAIGEDVAILRQYGLFV